MRFSLRKAVKLTTFLALFMLLNVWISYNVNVWSFNNFDDRGKLLQTLGRALDRDSANGGVVPLPPEKRGHLGMSDEMWVQSPTHFARVINQKSAKGINIDNETVKPFQSADAAPEKTLVAAREAVKRPRVDASAQELQKYEPTHYGETEQRDVFISVKTTSKYHDSRIRLILRTWYLLARDQVYFFTDEDDAAIAEVLGDHLINTNCSMDHSRRALSCKMAVEFDYYLASRKRWFCHVDDDVYLNVPRLVEKLKSYNHKEDWYLGKPSLKYPLEVLDRENPGMKLTFWFATGGAGFCISRSLALKMAPYAGGGRFMTTAENIRLPDDCTLGYIIEHLLKHRLTVVEEFHSHLEALWLIKPHLLERQITFSFSEYSGKQNVINVRGFSEKEDPTRFRSLHCYLFPNFRDCRALST